MKRLLTVLAIQVLFFTFCSKKTLGQQDASLLKLRQELRQMNVSPTLKHANWGFVAKSLKTGQVIAQINSEKTLTTASTMKVLTSGAALGLLGEDFTFTTTLEYDGKITADSTLHGNLYIRGGGDPTLGSGRINGYDDTPQLMKQWTAAVKKAGIKKIDGYIVADASLFEDNIIPKGWQWSDIGNYYGAGVSGLNINENLYIIRFKPGKVGDPATILKTVPEIPGLEFANAVTTGKPGSGDNAYIYGTPYTYFRQVQGTVPAGVSEFEIKGSMPDAPLLCAQLLYNELVENKIDIQKNATTTNLLKRNGTSPISKRTQFYVHQSPPLKEIVYHLNVKSLNLYAESLLKILGAKFGGDGTTEAGLEVIQEFWAKKGLNTTNGFFMEDGSGLSSANSLTPQHLAEVCYIISKEDFAQAFQNSLPVAGISGTLAPLVKGTAAQGKVKAKSGTLTRVMCYTGYVTTSSGDQLCFAMMANRYDGDYYSMRKKFERLMVLMAELK
jgi:D-alanyl-D-alanine carboxypeptidase/D-alanyl-D-alanine-endopeptidase (penicillin-binding protein 4)